MNKSFIIIFFLIIALQNLEAQTGYVWQFNLSGDSIFKNVPSEYIFDTEYKFDDVNLKLNEALEEYIYPDLNNESVKGASNENHKFLIRIDSIEYAFYNLVTFHLRKNDIVVYEIRTTLEGNWNDDFAQWIFSYTKEFGIVAVDYFDWLETNSIMTTSGYFLFDKGKLSKRKQTLLFELSEKLRAQD